MSQKNALEIMLDQQALSARRAMVRSGELLTEQEFRKRLGPRARNFARLAASGSVFPIDVGDEWYFPALLADANVNLKRLYATCRLIFPAPPASRYFYLIHRQGNLGGVTPLSCLDDDAKYRVLRKMARGFASEYSRTTLAVYSGNHVKEPTETKPVYLAVTEIDPRTKLWKRCLATIRVGGFEAPHPPYPQLGNQSTAFITESPASNVTNCEARLYTVVEGGIAKVRIARAGAPGSRLHNVDITKAEDIKSAMLLIFTSLLNKDKAPVNRKKQIP